MNENANESEREAEKIKWQKPVAYREKNGQKNKFFHSKRIAFDQFHMEMSGNNEAKRQKNWPIQIIQNNEYET